MKCLGCRESNNENSEVNINITQNEQVNVAGVNNITLAPQVRTYIKLKA